MTPLLLLTLLANDPPPARPVDLERIAIDDDFPSAYQVEIADVDGDGRPDVVALGGGTCAWYRNPGWEKRIVAGPETTPGIISSATADLDGDGRAEVAIAYEFAMAEPTKGRLGLAIPGESLDAPWRFRPIAELGSIHRLRWGQFHPDAAPELIAAPIFGRGCAPPTFDQTSAVVTLFHLPEDPIDGRWTAFPFGPPRKVLHAIGVVPAGPGPEGRAGSLLLTADRSGVGEVAPRVTPAGEIVGEARLIAPGVDGQPLNGGASEVHLGRYADGRAFVAAINPWHGNRVVILDLEADGAATGGRVVDETLADGHALCVADVDGDGTDEVFAGHRGADHRVSMYRFDGADWQRTVVDRTVAAQDLRAGDTVGDGTPEVVTVGGSTGNVVLYRAR